MCRGIFSSWRALRAWLAYQVVASATGRTSMNSDSLRVLPFSRVRCSQNSVARASSRSRKRSSTSRRWAKVLRAQSACARRAACTASRTSFAVETRTSPRSLPLPGSNTASVPCGVTAPCAVARGAGFCGIGMASAMLTLWGSGTLGGYARCRAVSIQTGARPISHLTCGPWTRQTGAPSRMLGIDDMLRLCSLTLDTPAERAPAEKDAVTARPPTVLVVDDDRSVREVLAAVLKEEGYPVRQAPSADAALQMLRGDDLPLLLCDLKMPEHDGLWLLDHVLQRHPHAAVVMLTGFGDNESAVDCLKRGATDYLLKPPRVTDLVRAIERAWSRSKLTSARARYHQGLARRVRDRTAELASALERVAQSYSSTLVALVHALDAREHETSDHSQRVVRYTVAIARAMSIGEDRIEDIARGALLHDIGKIGVADSILLKPGTLTNAEWA